MTELADVQLPAALLPFQEVPATPSGSNPTRPALYWRPAFLRESSPENPCERRNPQVRHLNCRRHLRRENLVRLGRQALTQGNRSRGKCHRKGAIARLNSGSHGLSRLEERAWDTRNAPIGLLEDGR